MLELPNLKHLEHIVDWGTFLVKVLIPLCIEAGWQIDYEFVEDRWCYVMVDFKDLQKFIDSITPFCQKRSWQVKKLCEEGAVIFIQAPASGENSDPELDARQLNFFDLCPVQPKQTNHYQDEVG